MVISLSDTQRWELGDGKRGSHFRRAICLNGDLSVQRCGKQTLAAVSALFVGLFTLRANKIQYLAFSLQTQTISKEKGSSRAKTDADSHLISPLN